MNYSYLTFIAVICFSFFSNLEAKKWNAKTIEEIKELFTELQPLLKNKNFQDNVNSHRSSSSFLQKQALFSCLKTDISHFLKNASDITKKGELRKYFSNIVTQLRIILSVVNQNKGFSFSFIRDMYNPKAHRFYHAREINAVWSNWLKQIELLLEINEELNKKLCTVM